MKHHLSIAVGVACGLLLAVIAAAQEPAESLGPPQDDYDARVSAWLLRFDEAAPEHMKGHGGAVMGEWHEMLALLRAPSPDAPGAADEDAALAVKARFYDKAYAIVEERVLARPVETPVLEVADLDAAALRVLCRQLYGRIALLEQALRDATDAEGESDADNRSPEEVARDAMLDARRRAWREHVLAEEREARRLLSERNMAEGARRRGLTSGQLAIDEALAQWAAGTPASPTAPAGSRPASGIKLYAGYQDAREQPLLSIADGKVRVGRFGDVPPSYLIRDDNVYRGGDRRGEVVYNLRDGKLFAGRLRSASPLWRIVGTNLYRGDGSRPVYEVSNGHLWPWGRRPDQPLYTLDNVADDAEAVVLYTYLLGAGLIRP